MRLFVVGTFLHIAVHPLANAFCIYRLPVAKMLPGSPAREHGLQTNVGPSKTFFVFRLSAMKLVHDMAA